jgi:sulfhydrogenase subunit beta (sulfur reductase)
VPYLRQLHDGVSYLLLHNRRGRERCDWHSCRAVAAVDSCFTLDSSYIHGGCVRTSAKARYRQWMTHKLASWIDQFGTSGFVGCGRCITWYSVGIDITEELQAIRGAGSDGDADA